jgi:hypothetical protein
LSLPGESARIFGEAEVPELSLENSSDREIVEYLGFLTEHTNECALNDCPMCITMQNICDLVASLLFTNEFFPDIRLSTPHPLPAERQPG